ncbi:MAG: peptide chain release factor 3 [Eubacteriales bacterium]|nr:peptide chain release factor 3 [Eubacteriales bacterium]
MYEQEINRRRTFAIISHPDAGKTTLTEKFLLYGGAINLAGTVKGRKASKTATSDWMDIEKERGISVTSSALQFNYKSKCINILDTPGHQDFSEDTYRTLMACDQAVMVIDCAKGVEAQTIKLFKVCTMRHIPIFTLINKLDRDSRDTFELLDEIEKVLGIKCCPINIPISSGKTFKGIYDRNSKKIITYNKENSGAKEIKTNEYSIDDSFIEEIIEKNFLDKLKEDIDLLDGACEKYDEKNVRVGKQTPVFFGSALSNFGIENFLDYFIEMSLPPMGRESNIGFIEPNSDDFSAFIFKIQANMNKMHRDRIAFMRICSGKYYKGMEVNLNLIKRKVKLSEANQLFAEDRQSIDEAYAGDIVGLYDPGVFSIGETLSKKSNSLLYDGIPTFAPEHFARVKQIDTMKRKQFVKGIMQIALEGAIQIFNEVNSGMEEIIVGVVGELQFEVFIYRLLNEYNVEIKLDKLPYGYIRWIENYQEINLHEIKGTQDMKIVEDTKKRPLLLFSHEWSISMVLERNKNLVLKEFSK